MCYSHLFCKANDGLLLLSIASGKCNRKMENPLITDTKFTTSRLHFFFLFDSLD